MNLAIEYADALVIRNALLRYFEDLDNEGLGDDEYGEALATDYKARICALLKRLQKEGV